MCFSGANYKNVFKPTRFSTSTKWNNINSKTNNFVYFGTPIKILETTTIAFKFNMATKRNNYFQFGRHFHASILCIVSHPSLLRWRCHVPWNSETDVHLKTCRFHIKSLCKTSTFLHSLTKCPFGILFKRHCTRQGLDFVLSLTVRTPFFWGDAAYVPRILKPKSIRKPVHFM